MKVKMLKDAKGSDDGFSVKAFLSGEEYEVGDALAAAFVDDMKVAERLDAAPAAEKAADAPKTKAKKDDPPKD